VVEIIDNILFIFQRLDWLSLVDILIVTVIFSALLLYLRNTQAMVLMRGVLFLIILISVFASITDLPAFGWLVSTTLPALLLSIPVVFAPEIRRGLERIGRASNIIGSRGLMEETSDVISAVVHATTRLSHRRHGALIVLQRLDSLADYENTGVKLGANVTAELLLQIFYPNTPLHDGAVIISGEKVTAASCVMPLSSSGVLSSSPERMMGLRHRAGLGTSEVTDSVSIIVSEENGNISVATNGRMIHRLDSERLESILKSIYKPEEAKDIEHLLKKWFGWLSFTSEKEQQEIEVE
jgi:diadenylate cyclase